MLKIASRLIHWKTTILSEVGTLGEDIGKWKRYLEREAFLILFHQVIFSHLLCPHRKQPAFVHKARGKMSLLLEKNRNISCRYPERQTVCSKRQNIFQETGHYSTRRKLVIWDLNTKVNFEPGLPRWHFYLVQQPTPKLCLFAISSNSPVPCAVTSEFPSCKKAAP